MFSSSAPIQRWASPKERAQRWIGHWQDGCLMSASQNENLNCSVNCYIVTSLTILSGDTAVIDIGSFASYAQSPFILAYRMPVVFSSTC